MDKADVVIAGAGVIGLAIARELALAGRDVVVIERERRIGMETSSRNSEVVHAGIYYPQGSLKARLCVEGREALYAYCDSHGVPHRRTGKLIVATSAEEVEALASIRASSHANGVGDVDWIAPVEAAADQPGLVAVAALRSPATGIVDSHAYMLALLGEAEERGAMVAFGTRLTGAACTDGRHDLFIDEASEPSLRATCLINAAGLQAPTLAARFDGLDPRFVPRQWLAKGSYFSLVGRSPFTTLIYPVPAAGGLGVHLTIDLGGQARFGPDAEWIDTVDYAVDPARGERFYAAIRRYWPDLPDGALQPAYAGIRPKLAGPGEPAADFRIDGPAVHGVPGLVNLFGIESPGLTASLAIARHVRELVE